MGVWLLCAIAVVVALIWISAMVGVGSTDIDKQPQRYVDDQQGFGLWWGLAYVVGLALLIPGLVGLTAHVAARSSRRLALAGMAFGIVSIGLLESMFGAMSLGSAVVADAYDDGNTTVLPVLKQFEGGHLAHILQTIWTFGVLLGLLAAIAYGVALWRSGDAPKWVAIVFGLGFVLFVTSIPFTTLPGCILLAVASFRIARGTHAPAPVGAVQLRPS
jgi:hypothetical protein